MGRPLNMYELDWLRAENERLKKEGGGEEVAQLRERVRQLEAENHKLREAVDAYAARRDAE